MKLLKWLPTVLFLATSSMAAAGASPIALRLDTAKTGAPISPYIYGQFVEHLGRCIYGGIWAEMLEDRKFYFPISATYAPYKDLTNSAFPVVGASPWQIIGNQGGVTMVKEDAFVGSHSPRVNAGAGIRQRDLGLVAGKGYTGYLWAKPLAGEAEIEVALAWGEGVTNHASSKVKFSGGKFSRRTFAFTSKAGTDQGQLEIRVLRGDVLLGPPSLMPADHWWRVARQEWPRGALWREVLVRRQRDVRPVATRLHADGTLRAQTQPGGRIHVEG